MNTKFKRHDKVKLLIDPDPEYVEYHNPSDEEEIEEKIEQHKSFLSVKKGMLGRINILLPNGQYHVEILDKKGNTVAYAPMSEDHLEKIE